MACIYSNKHNGLFILKWVKQKYSYSGYASGVRRECATEIVRPVDADLPDTVRVTDPACTVYTDDEIENSIIRRCVSQCVL